VARLLLIDSDERHAKALADALERHQHSVVASVSRESVPTLLKSGDDFDLVIFYASLNIDKDLRTLSEITRSQGSGMTPIVLYVARLYQGPRLRLEIERRGVRFIHEC
jgi:DNA-binding response OmpR family regulator